VFGGPDEWSGDAVAGAAFGFADRPMRADEFAVLMVLVGGGAVVALAARRFTQSFIRTALVTSVVVCTAVQAYLATRGYDWHKDKFAMLVVLYPAGISFAAAGAVHVALHIWHYRRSGGKQTVDSSRANSPTPQ
jgi:hypothetical protein